MTVRLSQGAQEAWAGQYGTDGESGTGFALVLGAGAADTITRGAGDFTNIFKKGDKLHVFGAADSADDIEAVIADVAALTITLPASVFTTGQASGSQMALVVPVGGSFPDVYNGGTLNIYNGTRPASGSDDIGAATLLLQFTDIQFAAVAYDSTEEKAYVEAAGLSAVVVAMGTAVWGRITAPGDNASGSSTTAKRIDGICGINTGDFQMKALNLNVGETVTLSSLKIRVPAS